MSGFPIFKKRTVVLLVMVLLVFVTGCGQWAPSASPQEMATATPEPDAVDSGPVRVQSEGEVPFYARFGMEDIYHDEEWAVIVFYRPPDCVPEDFNMLRFFDGPTEDDPGAFACGPVTTRSTETWKTGPEVDGGPLQAEIEGRGSVPVWFLAWSDLQAAMDGGVVTIGELKAVQSLLIGSATSYVEFIRPEETNLDGGEITFKAEGALENGDAFTFNIHQEEIAPENNYAHIELP